jgi:hypothetical protein
LIISTEDQELVEGFWKEYVDGFIHNDLNRCVHDGANYLAALGEMCYVDFLGKLMTSKKNNSKDNFKTFVKAYLPRYANPPAFLENLYQEVRSGLVHSYFPENVNVIAREKVHHGPPSIWQEKDGKWTISVADFLSEFKVASDALKRDLLEGKYLAEFKKVVSENPGLDRIPLWPVVTGPTAVSSTTTTVSFSQLGHPPPTKFSEE